MSIAAIHVLVKVCVRADKNGCVKNDMLANNNTFSLMTMKHSLNNHTPVNNNPFPSTTSHE